MELDYGNIEVSNYLMEFSQKGNTEAFDAALRIWNEATWVIMDHDTKNG